MRECWCKPTVKMTLLYPYFCGISILVPFFSTLYLKIIFHFGYWIVNWYCILTFLFIPGGNFSFNDSVYNTITYLSIWMNSEEVSIQILGKLKNLPHSTSVLSFYIDFLNFWGTFLKLSHSHCQPRSWSLVDSKEQDTFPKIYVNDLFLQTDSLY